MNPAIGANDAPISSAPTERRLSTLSAIIDRGELTVEFPRQQRILFRGAKPGPHAFIKIHRWRALVRLLSGWDIGFAEGFIAGDWSTTDLVTLLTFAACNRHLEERRNFLWLPHLALKVRHWRNRNTRKGSRRNISAHYDLGNGFYRRWLDAGMTYSSAIFSKPDQSLEEAQFAKLDRVIALLDCQPNDRVLEIGFGWGSFVERLLQRHVCSLIGVTLSKEQLDFARDRLAHEILSGRCDLHLRDYREVQGTFDRIVSIEMLEAVGEAYWPIYFKTLAAALRPGGIAVLQVITIDNDRFKTYREAPDFIQKHVFPGGMLPTDNAIRKEVAEAGLYLVETELFGESYATTLAQWRTRFQDAWPEIAALGYDERFKRMWEYYLSYCQTGFALNALNVAFYKLSKPALIG